jgi:hypothetical protein
VILGYCRVAVGGEGLAIHPVTQEGYDFAIGLAFVGHAKRIEL